MLKDDYECTANTTQQIIKASLRRVKRKVPYILSRTLSIKMDKTATLASLESRTP